MSDRTGELCPFCKKGTLYPTGRRLFSEPDTEPKRGETHREYTEYECDNCKQRTRAHGINLVASTTATGEVKVNDDIKKPKKSD